MTRTVLFLAILAAPVARADLMAHALVRYGNGSLTVDEQFGSPAAAASLLYTSPGQFHGTAEATAGYGQVSVAATVLGVNTGHPINSCLAEGAFSDTLTVNGAVGAGFIVYTYGVEGWAEGELSSGALFLKHGTDPDEELDDEIAGPEEFASSPHAIVFGQPFTTGIVFQGRSAMGLAETGEFGAVLTATLTGIEVFDSAMEPIGAFSVTSGSGTQYPLPAPGSGSILLAGAALFQARRRR